MAGKRIKHSRIEPSSDAQGAGAIAEGHCTDKLRETNSHAGNHANIRCNALTLIAPNGLGETTYGENMRSTMLEAVEREVEPRLKERGLLAPFFHRVFRGALLLAFRGA
ncbi:hypothetical protein GCM10028811_34840 [Uliginosibacterium sediminicola]